MKKVYVLFCLFIAGIVTNVDAQILLQWNTFGNAGTETTEPSVFNDPNLSGVTNLTQGTITAAANGNRFGGSGWFNTGNTVAGNTLTEAVAGNDYIQFIVTPNVGFSFTPTSLVFTWDRSGTGPQHVTLRSSSDGFTSDLGTVTSMSSGGSSTTTVRTITITTLTNITVATTFRLYGYGATATGGTGGFDNASSVVDVELTGTTASAGGPTITVTPATLTGFIELSGVPTAEQTYDVEGSDLTNDIIITPPVGYEIATVTGGPYTANPAFITLTQAGGTVASTPIFVRMNSATLGVNAGDISHTSTGATTKDVAVTGNVIDAEPTVQSVITFGAITNSTIQVNFTGGDGAKRILVAKALTAVTNDPADGTTYTGNSVFGSGSNLGAGNFAVYTGALNTVLVSGLTAGTSYHFAVYEYNDAGGTAGAENYLLPGGIGDAATIDVPLIYTWIGGNSTWNTAANWAPARLFPATNDILLFLDGTTETVTDVPNESIGQLHVTLNTHVTLQAAVNNTVLNINGNVPFEDFTVDPTSSLTIGGANSFVLNLATGTNGIVDGLVSLIGTGATVHKLTAADADGVSFNTSSKFVAGAGLSGNPFGNVTAGSVVFISGSEMEQVSGSNPFAIAAGVVTFQTGSLYKITGATFTPSFSGRTYANVQIDAVGYSVSSTGGSPLSIDDLTITNGTQNLNLTGGISIKGNISVAAGATLGFSPATANTLFFNGTASQSINNLGTISFNGNLNVNMNNATGLTLNTPITLSGNLTFTAGVIYTNTTDLLTMTAGSSVSGASDASFVDGPVSKIGNTNFTFPVGKTNAGPSGSVNGIAAVAISNFVGGLATDQYTAEYIRGNPNVLAPKALGIHHVSKCDYWTLNQEPGTASTVDVTVSWNEPVNNCTYASPYVDNLVSLLVAHYNTVGGNWDTFGGLGTAIGTNTAGTITWPGVSVFSPFALGSMDVSNPLPITINYFNGTRNNGNHLLNWKVTCISTPSATIEIERSSDAVNYSPVYSIFATAVRCQQPFDFTDNQPAKGINYYRLKMTDINGKVTYSTIVSLINASKGIDVMNIAPNPIVNGNFNLKISTAEKTQMELVITDMQGRILQKRSVNMIAGFNTIPMNVPNLAAGTYQLFGNNEDGRTRVLRFVIQ